jgi:hypothetical protein
MFHLTIVVWWQACMHNLHTWKMQVWSRVVCLLMSSRNPSVLLCFVGALYRTRRENGFSLDLSLDYQRESQPIHLPIDQREYQHIDQAIDQPPFRRPNLHRIILRRVLWRMYRPSCQLWVQNFLLVRIGLCCSFCMQFMHIGCWLLCVQWKRCDDSYHQDSILDSTLQCAYTSWHHNVSLGQLPDHQYDRPLLKPSILPRVLLLCLLRNALLL